MTSVGTVFAIGTWELMGTTVVMGADVGGEVGTPRESSGTEGTKEWVWVLTMSEEVDLECSMEDGSEWAVRAGVAMLGL